MRMNTKKLILASLLLSAALLTAGSAYAATIYFPHVDTSLPWQTEIAIVNTSDQTVTGTLSGLSDAGQLVETKPVTLSGHGRRQIVVANEFTNHIDIGYIVFDASSDTVQGYTKFYQAGIYRAAIPAVKEVNTADIFISHIDSSADWWTGISLVNTTSSAKVLTITFNNGQSRQITINANAHMPLTIESLFNNQPQPDIKSAVITNANGIIGLELFGNVGGSNHLDGLLLSDNTTSTIYYPHVASDNVWWTGIVAYNPSELAGSITITPYSAQGTLLSSSTLPLPGKGKYIGAVAQLGLPDQTAWFKIDSTSPITGFELFGTLDGNLLAAYAEGGGTGAKTGIFAKIEKDGWTGIAFVNTEATAASVTLTAYDDNGTVVATQVLPVGGHAKVVNLAEAIFSQNISSATYITYSSDRNVVGFQLNGSSDGTMLDGLPALADTAPTSGVNGTITGTAMKGPVSGATVTAFAINSGVMGAQIGTGTTDAQGNFTMAIGAYSGPVMLRMSGGTYTDEATGAAMTMQSGDIMTSMMPQAIAGAVMSRGADNASYLHGPDEGTIDERRHDPREHHGGQHCDGELFFSE